MAQEMLPALLCLDRVKQQGGVALQFPAASRHHPSGPMKSGDYSLPFPVLNTSHPTLTGAMLWEHAVMVTSESILAP